ncbi:chaperone NapD [Helicobacter sp. MIT 05-5294]|uniref:chaperone NapD n=1 Tax=Helicobacter sp. MIT 05-5294 TaxID=1548150 RepID=UPI00051FD46F|nr:chaperone NapD [Helicobacter sp. MIT 05-5294]TLD86994.1 nitrate reductase [Helicobacter sp. MIT 05-5294]
MQEDFNVSSLVVLCTPQNIESLWDKINQIEGAECHYRDGSGKIIVTLESQSIEEEIRLLKRIEKIEGVLSAQMIYAYHSTELEAMRQEIAKQESVPKVLQNEQSSAQGIVYNGDVQSALDEILEKDK